MSVAVTRMFPGGIHPREIGNGKSATQSTPIRNARSPVRVVIALQQHIGAPCQSLVQAGDRVDLGQMIGQSEAFISAPVHASVSGKVVKLDRCVLANGLNAPAIVIDNDFEDRWHPDCTPRTNVEALSPQELVQIVRNAGIVGLGGATFPTSVKLSPPKGRAGKDDPATAIDTILLNGAECEPYLTSDHRLMLEATQEILDGFQLARKMVGASRAIIGIEDNKPDAIESMRKAAQGFDMQVVALPVQYPQGGEKQLIHALTGRTVPVGELPASVGTVVINVGTAAAISKAVREGKPIIDRIVTLTGRINHPANLRVRIGTTIVDLVDECGGFTEGVEKVVMGGPMMGIALARLDLPVTKGTSSLLALGAEAFIPCELNCMNCGRCTKACPMRLLPNKIDAAARRSRWAVAEEYNALACIECGCCSYVCPSKRELTQSCRTAKAGIQAERQRHASHEKKA